MDEDINRDFPVDKLVELACDVDQDVEKAEREERERKDLDNGFCNVAV